ncbi:DUF2851 family protein [soil metagenome]
MQEDFLHYIWKFKKFDFRAAGTVDGEQLVISEAGIANTGAGPDFFNARIRIGNQVWAGNVEIHIKSSHWYAHKHEEDPNYDNVILHVVWEDDIEIFRKDDSIIPTLELKDLVSKETLQTYHNLLLAPNAKWINCEDEFHKFDGFELDNWLERMYFEKLQKKSESIKIMLQNSENDWEAVLFRLFARNFGSRINADSFLSMAQSLDFKIIKKCTSSRLKLEAVLFGQSGMLDKPFEDGYFLELKNEYNFLRRKYGLENYGVERPKYFRLRPDNFPNIRLSQFADLYSSRSHLFSAVVATQTRKELHQLLSSETSEYWKGHYNFSKPHRNRTKKLSVNFIDLVIINTIIPIQFAWKEASGSHDNEKILDLIQEIKAEENSIIEKYNSIRPLTAQTALQSQALLHLKNEYCDKNYCLKCNLGSRLLKGDL